MPVLVTVPQEQKTRQFIVPEAGKCREPQKNMPQKQKMKRFFVPEADITQAGGRLDIQSADYVLYAAETMAVKVIVDSVNHLS